MDIPALQEYLREHQLDGWLLADFHGYNDIFVNFLGITGMLSRRAFYFIPSEGEPVLLANPIEQDKFIHVPGRILACLGYRRLESELSQLLAGRRRIAMEYSPQGRLPYIAKVDAGTIETVRSLGIEIVSSADLVAHFHARLSVEQIATHRLAARNVCQVKDSAFAFIADGIKSGRTVREHDVCRFILDQFESLDMETDHGPNCSVNGNAGNPHYEPTEEKSTQIRKGDLILIDLWARTRSEHGIYADITWMGFAGTSDEIPQRYRDLFAVIVAARDRAVGFLRENVEKRPVYGYEVDDACREVIEDAGYGENFFHRTGHSIGREVHSVGPNIDNLETEDQRKLQKGHLFSVEPGVYFDDCGLRTEIDVLIGHDGVEITTLPLQTEILPLL